MTAYDFWEPLSLRLPSRVMRILSGDEPNRQRARCIETWIHARRVPIGLLRETEPEIVLVDDDVEFFSNLIKLCDSLHWSSGDTSI